MALIRRPKWAAIFCCRHQHCPWASGTPSRGVSSQSGGRLCWRGRGARGGGGGGGEDCLVRRRAKLGYEKQTQIQPWTAGGLPLATRPARAPAAPTDVRIPKTYVRKTTLCWGTESVPRVASVFRPRISVHYSRYGKQSRFPGRFPYPRWGRFLRKLNTFFDRAGARFPPSRRAQRFENDAVPKAIFWTRAASVPALA